MHKISILIVVSNLEFGGAQRQIVELVNHLNQAKFNIFVCSLSSYNPLAEQIRHGINFHVIQKRFRFDLSVPVKLAFLIRKFDIDLIHSYLFDAEIASRLAALLSMKNIAVIGSERNTDYSLKPVQIAAYKLTNGLVHTIIANSQSGADFNAALLGLTKNIYKVVYNGVNTERFKPGDKNAHRQALGLGPEIPIIGMFASFKEQKNHSLLLKAVEKILCKYPSLKVLLVGDTLHGGQHGSYEYHTKIRDMISDLNLDEVCIQLGNRKDIQNIYPACDFTVLPSHYEGTPNVVLESMASGVPVIATRVSDNDRIIEHGKSGLLVEPDNVTQLADEIDGLLREIDRTDQLGIEARTRMIDYFSTMKLAENIEDIYLSNLRQIDSAT